MHTLFANIPIVAALVGSIVLVMQTSDRLFPMLALVASGVEALLAFGIMSLSLAKFRIDIILPALLVVSAGICWVRMSTKPTITAATVATFVGAIQLIAALSFLH
jgi:hypothetical protein